MELVVLGVRPLDLLHLLPPLVVVLVVGSEGQLGVVVVDADAVAALAPMESGDMEFIYDRTIVSIDI